MKGPEATGFNASVLRLFTSMMERILVRASGRHVDKMMAQDKQLLLSRLLIPLARGILNPLSSLDTHAELLEGDSTELGPQAKAELVGRLGIHGKAARLEVIRQQFVRPLMAQEIVAPPGSSIQTANAPNDGAEFSGRLLLRPKENYDGQVKD